MDIYTYKQIMVNNVFKLLLNINRMMISYDSQQ